MITNGDLAAIPMDVARAAAEPDSCQTEAWDRFADQLVERSLDRVQRVILRLLSQASTADPDARHALLGDVDDLDAALRAAREVVFPPTGPHDHGPPSWVRLDGQSAPSERRRTLGTEPAPWRCGAPAQRTTLTRRRTAAAGHRAELADRITAVAGDLAAIEDRVVDMFEHLADRRPHAAQKLRANAERAREVGRLSARARRAA